LKKILVLLPGLLFRICGLACPACEARQPKILRGITHGAGPSGKWDYFIVGVAVVIVMFTLFYSVKWLIRPGEKSAGHIKRIILNPE
jgi:hypothetical protein